MRIAPLVVVLDTCALFPQTLRDTLLRAAEAGLYSPRWSKDILEELRRNLQEDRGLNEEQARHLLTAMDSAFPEAIVNGYSSLIGRMTNHPDDRHVLAAAVQWGAQVIVTDNLKDFPEDALSPYDLEAQTPDEFLQHLFDRHPEAMERILLEQNASRQKPPETLEMTLARLNKSAPGFVLHMRRHGILQRFHDEN